MARPKPNADDLDDIQRNLLAVQHLIGQMKDLAGVIIYDDPSNGVANRVMDKLGDCFLALKKVHKELDVRKPNCEEGWHEYAGRCVPDMPGPDGG